MPVAVLTALKLLLLLVLYVFLARVVRVMARDLAGRATEDAKPHAGVAPLVPTPAPPSRPVRRPPRELVVHAPDDPPRVVALDQDELSIGRSPDAGVVIEDGYASDEHALVAADNGGWLVRDLGSTNGTFVNGAKITGETTLHSGDQIRIGKTRIEVRR